MPIEPFRKSPGIPTTPQNELHGARQELHGARQELHGARQELQRVQQELRRVQRELAEVQTQEELLLQKIDTIERSEPLHIPLDLLSPNPWASRIHIDDDFVDQLAESIKSAGLSIPINVRRDPNKPEAYQIVCGGLRWRAFKKLGYETIPAFLIEAEDAKMGFLSLIENIHREPYTTEELEEAKKTSSEANIFLRNFGSR